MNESFSPNTRNVLVGVDVQNDFISGSLAVDDGEQVVAPLNKLANAVRETDGIVIFTRDWHPEKTPHFDNWPVHCVENTTGADFDPRLKIHSGDIILSKGTGQTDGYSGMEGVGPQHETLESLIQPKNPEDNVRVLIGGLATDYCVKATVLDLAKRFRSDQHVGLYLVRDAVKAVNIQSSDEQVALREIERAGVEAMSSEQMLRTFFKRGGTC